MFPKDRNISLTNDELKRYSRHLVLPEFGKKSQLKLKQSKVLCIGSGGLGSPLLTYLAAAGVGTIGIVDFDFVELSNLQRQIIHKSNSIGKLKTESAKKSILELNPECNVQIYNILLNSLNALEIINQYDVICDGTDNFPTRYLVNDACVILGKPNVYGSIFKFEGQASVFNLTKDSPNYRDLIPEPPTIDVVPSCAEAGVIGVLPGIIGIIQATETIKILTGIGKTLDGRLLVYDALDMTFRELKLGLSKDREEIKHLIDYEEFCSPTKNNIVSDKTEIKEILSSQLNSLLEKVNNNVILIDVRSEVEYEISKIENSILFPLKEIESKLSINSIRKLSQDKRVIVYCKSGKRSLKALKILDQNDINCENLIGGIDAWEIFKDKFRK